MHRLRPSEFSLSHMGTALLLPLILRRIGVVPVTVRALDYTVSSVNDEFGALILTNLSASNLSLSFGVEMP